MRARLPDKRRLRRARGRESLLRSLRPGRTRHLADAGLVRDPLAHLEDAGALPCPPIPRNYVRRARERAFGPATGGGELPFRRIRIRRAGGHGRHGHRPGRRRLAFTRRVVRAPSRRRQARSRHWPGLHLPDDAAGAVLAALGCPMRSVSRRYLTATTAGRKTTHATGSGTTAGSWNSSSPRYTPSRTRPSPSKTASAGDFRPRPRRSSTQGEEPSAKRKTTWLRFSPVSSALAWSSRGPPTPSSGPRPARGWPKPCRAGRGWSSWPARAIRRMPATPSRSTCSSASSLTRSGAAPGRAEALDPQPESPEARPVHFLPYRARARPPGPGHRRRAAPTASRPGDRLAGPASGYDVPRAPRESGSIPHPPNSPASRATSSENAPTMTCTASRPGGGWTRSSWPTSWSSMTWSKRIITTCGSATKPGNSTTTCTRTPSRSEQRMRG